MLTLSVGIAISLLMGFHIYLVLSAQVQTACAYIDAQTVHIKIAIMVVSDNDRILRKPCE
eukprot:SAG31_NODE_22000_length_536_cov_0.702517_1_plen_59_part_10